VHKFSDTHMTEHTSHNDISASAEVASLWSIEQSELRRVMEVEFEMALIEQQSVDGKFSPQRQGRSLHEKVVPQVFFEIVRYEEAQKLLLDPSRPPSEALHREIRVAIRHSLSLVLAA
jgi:hypothetical protein